MKLIAKIVPWLVLSLFAAEIFVAMQPKRDGVYHVREFGRLPVLHGGRIQPFDSLARNSLLQLRSTGSVPLEGNGADGSWGEWEELRKKPKAMPLTERNWWQFAKHPRKLKSTEWLLEVMAKPELADTRPVFLIHHSDLLTELKLQDKGIERSALRYYTFNEIKSAGDEILEQGRKASAVKEEQRTTFQKQVLKLANAVNIYNRLKYTLQPAGEDNWAQELEQFTKDIGPARVAARAGEEGKELDRDAIERVRRPVKLFDEMSVFAYALVVPPLDPEASREQWQSAGDVLLQDAHSDEIHPAVRYLAEIGTAYRADNAAAFNEAVEGYRSWLQPRFPKEVSKGRAEFYYNDVKAFLHATIIYICAFILGGICLVTLNVVPLVSETCRRSAFYLILLAGAVHTFGLVFRMVLEGRPPVTNLYSSAIFIGWGAMVLGVVIERIYRIGIGIIVASFAGFVTLLIAYNLALGGDTMEMLRAVLDTNFWLSTHVVIVTLGYASTFFAGLLAILYVVLGLFTPLLTQKLKPADSRTLPVGNRADARTQQKATAETGGVEIGKALTKMIYGIICFATLFSFTGTVLGGIWADQSWGRFWGWDPKENGALMIVIWNALILHARWGGLVRERGLVNLAIFGNIATSFSWFGVNMLGIGLHSYGFMDAAFQWLMLFVVTQLLLIGDGLLPSQCWRSFAAAKSGSGRALRWVAIASNAVVLFVGFLAGFGSFWCAVCVLAFFAFVLTIRFTSRGELPPPLAASPESPGPKKTSVRPAAA